MYWNFFIIMSCADSIQTELEADPRWQLVQRVVTSSGFSRSVRLSEFLVFISRTTIEGQTANLNEHQIGVKVFGRSSGYLQSEDNIVRANASRLRQRLEEYFATEGQDEELRLSLPRGGYVPEFFKLASQHAPGDSVAAIPTESPEHFSANSASVVHDPGPRRLNRKILPILAALLAVAVIPLLLYRHKTQASRTAEIHASLSPSTVLWATLFDKNSPTLVVPADSSLMLYESLANRDISLAEYINGSYRTMPDDGTDDLKFPKALARRRLTSMSDLEFAATIAGNIAQTGGKLEIRYARDLETDDLGASNAVLLGGRYANPWVSLFDSERKFALIRDPSSHVLSVENHAPAAGEFNSIPFHPGQPEHLAYALAAYVPNLREGRHVLILEGTSIAGTKAAVDFIFDSSRVDALLAKHMKPGGIVPCFELVLESNDYSGTATKANVITSRFW